MTEAKPEESYYSDRIKRAAHMLFFKHGRIPGSRSWELKTGLGKEYLRVLSQLDEQLKDLDLEVKKVQGQIVSDYKPSVDSEDESRYFVRLRGTLAPREARMTGWRLDNLAALAASLSLVVSKQGKTERKDVEEAIGHKVGRWKALTLMDAFLRSGYLEEDEDGLVKLGWRTKAEIDLQSLMMLIAESKPKQAPVDELTEDGQDDVGVEPSTEARDEVPVEQSAP
ncbi:MAG TPA: hypothetical protein VFE98_11175 [Candidatus Bathyarchaeia archaeon]|nr:hypothetical protein [Candidatus Bathyarchaeia archaeon]